MILQPRTPRELVLARVATFHFYFSFDFEIVMRSSSNSRDISGTDICSYIKFSLVEHVDYVIPLCEYCSKLQFMSIIWKAASLCFGCALQLRILKCCYVTGLAQTKLVFPGTDLDEVDRCNYLIVTFHLVVINRMKCLLIYRRLDGQLPIWIIGCVYLTSRYRTKTEYKQQQWGRFCFTASNYGHWVRKIWEDCLCSKAVIFVVLVAYGGRIAS